MQDTAKNEAAILDRLRSGTNAKSDTDLARKLGLGQQSVANARAAPKVPDSWVRKAAKQFNLSADWLLFGEEPMYRGESGTELTPSINSASPQILETTDCEIAMVPMVEAVLSAGHGSFETGGESGRKYAFRVDFLRRKGDPSQMVLMRVDGDSMTPEIKSGDIVLIDQSQKNLRPGRIYAVGVEDMVFLKIISANPGKVILHSCNDAYPPLEIDTRGDLEDSVRIVGRCVWSCRDL